MNLSKADVAELTRWAQALEAALETEDLDTSNELALIREAAGAFLTAFQKQFEGEGEL